MKDLYCKEHYYPPISKTLIVKKCPICSEMFLGAYENEYDVCLKCATTHNICRICQKDLEV